MKWEDFAKFGLMLLVVALVLGLIIGSTDTSGLYGVIISILTAVVLLVVIATAGERSTELVKAILRWAFGNIGFLKNWQPSGAGSWMLALLPAAGAVFKLDVNIFSEFPIFQSLDPKLIQFLNVALVWLVESLVHNQIPAGVGSAPALKK